MRFASPRKNDRLSVSIGVFSLIAMLFAALGILVLWNSVAQPLTTMVIRLMCANALIWGVGVFFLHGWSRVTFTGVFSGAIAVLVGFSGFVSFDELAVTFPREWIGVAVGCATLIAITSLGFAWLLGALVPERKRKASATDSAEALWVVSVVKVFGTLLVAAPIAAQTLLFGQQPSIIFENTVYVGIILYCVGLVGGPVKQKLGLQVFVLLSYIFLYVEVVHTGGGRMRIVSLCIAVLLLATLRWKIRWLKPVIVASAPLFIAFVGRLRLEHRSNTGASSTLGSSGLESIYQPIGGFAQVLYDLSVTGAGRIDSRGQWSFFSAMLPGGRQSDYWNPFGYQFGQLWTMGEASAEYSAYALWYGELVSYWGVFGLLGSVVLTGAVLVLGDRALRLASVDGTSLGLIALIVISLASVGSLLWGGFYLAFARLIMQVLILLAAWVVLLVIQGAIRQPGRKATLGGGFLAA